MSTRSFLVAYAVAFLAMGVLDALWLGWLARDFYRRELGELLAHPIRTGPAIAFYVLYPLGLVFLALQPQPASLGAAALRCAAVGLVAYGVYDLTNLATLRGWSARLSLVDAAWGTCASAVAGTLAWWVALGRSPAPTEAG